MEIGDRGTHMGLVMDRPLSLLGQAEVRVFESTTLRSGQVCFHGLSSNQTHTELHSVALHGHVFRNHNDTRRLRGLQLLTRSNERFEGGSRITVHTGTIGIAIFIIGGLLKLVLTELFGVATL